MLLACSSLIYGSADSAGLVKCKGLQLEIKIMRRQEVIGGQTLIPLDTALFPFPRHHPRGSDSTLTINTSNVAAAATSCLEIGQGASAPSIDLLGTVGPMIQFQEVSAVPGGLIVAGKGRLWVKDDAPNVLKFTDDAGTDHSLNAQVVLGGVVEVMSSGASTASSTFADVPGVTTNITLRETSDVLVNWSASSFMDSLTGTVDFRVVVGTSNGSVVTSTYNKAGDHIYSSGSDLRLSIPAGVTTCKLQWRRLSGTGNCTMSTDDTCTLGIVAVPS